MRKRHISQAELAELSRVSEPCLFWFLAGRSKPKLDLPRSFEDLMRRWVATFQFAHVIASAILLVQIANLSPETQGTWIESILLDGLSTTHAEAL
jgi:hypothetical protein